MGQGARVVRISAARTSAARALVAVGLALGVLAPAGPAGTPAGATPPGTTEPDTGTSLVAAERPHAGGYPIDVSADGTRTLVLAESDGLVAGDTDGLPDVYVVDDAGNAELASSSVTGANVADYVELTAGHHALSGDGSRVCFGVPSAAPYGTGTTGPATLVKDLDDGSVLVASSHATSTCALSDDGGRVFFTAPAPTGHPGSALYARDLPSGAIETVSVGPSGTPYADDWPFVDFHTTRDGTVAIFEVYDESAGLVDFYRRNVVTDTTTLLIADVPAYTVPDPEFGTVTYLPGILSIDGTASTVALGKVCGAGAGGPLSASGSAAGRGRNPKSTSSAAAQGVTVARGPVDVATGLVEWNVVASSGEVETVATAEVPDAAAITEAGVDPVDGADGAPPAPVAPTGGPKRAAQTEVPAGTPVPCSELVDVATGTREDLEDLIAPGIYGPTLVYLSEDGERFIAAFLRAWVAGGGFYLTSMSMVVDVDTGERLAIDPSRRGGRSNASITLAYTLTRDGDTALFVSDATNLVGATAFPAPRVLRPYRRDLTVGDFEVRRPPMAPRVQASQGTGSRQESAPAPSDRVFTEDPVEPVSGNFVHPEIDVALSGGSGFAWTRVYNSLDDGSGLLGTGWTTPLDESVSVGAAGEAVVSLADGREVAYGPVPDGSWTRPYEFEGELTGDGSTGWQLRFPDGDVTTFGDDGLVTGWSSTTGEVDVVRSGGRPVLVDASWGPSIELDYDLAGNLVGLETDDGRTVAYGWTAGDLTSATGPNGATTTYGLDTAGRIASITDAAGVVTVTNSYDAEGRVTAQALPGNGSATFAYDTSAAATTVTNVETGETTVYAWAGTTVGAVTDALGQTMIRHVDEYGQVRSQTNRAGETTELDYDERGNILAVTSASGATTEHTYDGQDRLVESVAPDGGVTTYTYTGAERIPATVTDPTGGVTTQTVVGGRVVERVDADGVTTTYTYTADGLVDTVTDGEGGVTDHDYDDAGRLVRLESPEGAVTQRTYDDAGWLLSETAPDGGVTSYEYDDAGRPTEVTAPNGGVTTTAYDGFGRVSSVTDPLGNQTTYAYDDLGQLETATAPGGAVTTYVWGPMGRLESTTNPVGVTTSSTYDAAGRQVSTTTPAGTSTLTYDDTGRLASATDPIGRVSTYTYDAMDRVATTTDPAGGVTSFEYDLAGRQIATVDPEGGESTSVYTDAGRILTTTDPTGVETHHRYDDAGRQVAIADDAGNETVSVLDGDGRVVQTTSPEGRTDSRTYDALGRVLTEVDGAGVSTTRTWSSVGLLTEQLEGQAAVTYAYDLAGRLTQVTDAGGGVTAFAYDGRGNRTTVTDAMGQAWTTTWDLADRIVAETDPDGHVTTTTYDAAGRVDVTTDASGRTTDNAWDAAGQLTSVLSNGTTTVSYTYDAAGRRATMTDPTGTTAWTSDLAGRTLTETTPGADSVTYAYDAAGRRTALTSPGRSVTYDYDGRGLLESMTAGSFGATTYSWDRDGLLVAEDAPGAAVRNWHHDAAGRVDVYHDTNGVQTEMNYRTFDASGRPSGDLWTDGRISYYAYDPAGQLATVLSSLDGVDTYDYDLNGARVGECQTYVCWDHDVDDAGRRTVTTSAVDRGTYPAEVAADTPLGWWRLGEASGSVADDSTAGSHDGTYYTTALGSAGAVAGDANTAARFTAPSGIVLPTPAVSTAAGQATTVELWIRPTTATASYVLFSGNVVVSTNESYLLIAAGGTGAVYGDAGLTVGQWTHLTFTFVNGNLAATKLSADGNPVTLASYGTLGTPTLGSSLLVGSYGVAALVGDVDEVAVYAGTLSPERIAAHYQAAVGDRTATWDAAGRLLGEVDGRRSRTYAYDGRGLPDVLTETIGAHTWTQDRSYDGDGRLVGVATTSPAAPTPAPTDLTWDSAAAVPQLVELGSGALTWGVDGLLFDGAGFVDTDMNASVIRGARANSPSYDSMGSPTTRSTIDQLTLGYRGELTLGDLVHLRARDYAPSFGSFTTPDPLEGVVGTTTFANPYHYADNDPLGRVDPLGLRAADADFDEPDYWGNTRPRVLHFGMPIFPRFRGFGTAIIAGFIPQKEQPLLPGGPHVFKGDDREFSTDGYINPNRNRFYLEINFARGVGFVQVNPTCRVGGGCSRPFEIILNNQPNLSAKDFASQDRRWDRNYLDLGISDNGKAFRASWSVVHSVESFPGSDLTRPRADGAMTIEAEGSGWRPYYEGDCFPSIEMARELGGDRVMLGTMRDRGPASMIGFVSWARHQLGAYC